MPLGFFVTGGTLRRGTPSYVERHADQELVEALDAGEYCYVLTSRQMGKSSLMVWTAHRLREAGRRAVVVDLTALGQSVTSEQWYGGMIEILAEQLDAEETLIGHWESPSRGGPLRRWMGAMDKLLDEGPIVIFVDEIDAVRSLPFATDEFFAGIRECYNRRSTDPRYERLTFCLLGVATPSDLIRDTRTTPFNIGRRIELTDFAAGEAAPLASGLEPRAGAGPRAAAEQRPEARRLLERVLHWTGGHPYLTQRLCAAVQQRLAEGRLKSAARSPRSAVDTVCRELFFGDREDERDDNLRFVRDRLLGSSADRATLLDAYARVRARAPQVLDEADPLLDELRLSGIVRLRRASRGLQLRTRGKPQLAVRNRIYDRVFDARWVRAHMPDAEVQRQRAAFRRGVARASTLAGVVLLVMLGLTGVAVDRADAARRAQSSADGLVVTLSRSLTTQRSLNQQLAAALQAAQAARTRADRSAAVATTARADEARQKRAAVSAGRAAETQRGLAEQRRLLAEARRKDADRARAEAVRERGIAQGRLSRSHVAEGIREAEAGDGMAALAPLAEALRLDAGDPERVRMHRLRLAAVLDPLPRVVQGWFDSSDTVACQASRDGSRFLMAGARGTLRIVAAESGRVLREVQGGEEVSHAVLSPDERRVAVCGADGTARVWDLESGRPATPLLRTPPEGRFVEWSPDGTRIAVAARDGATVWNAETGRPVCRVALEGAISTRVRFTPDGARLVVTSMNYLAWLADAATGELVRRLGTCYNVFDAELSRGGQQVLLAGSYGGGPEVVGAFLIDLATGERVRTFAGRVMGETAAFSPDGRRVITGDAREARIWDAATGAPVGPPLPHRSGVYHVGFSADGGRMLTAGPEGTTRVWDTQTGQLAAPPVRHSGRVLCAVFGAEGRRLLVSGSDGSARLWDLERGANSTASLPLDEPLVEKPVALLHGRRLLTRSRPIGGGAERVRVWDAPSRQLLFPGSGQGEYSDFSLSADGDRILLSAAGAARLWELKSGRALSPRLAVLPDSRAVHLTRDGRRFLEWLGSKSVRLRDAETGRPLPWPGAPAESGEALVDTGGRYVGATFPGNRLRVWDTSPAAGPRLLPWSAPLDSPVDRIWFAPDARTMLAVTRGGVFRAWVVRTGRPLSPPLGDSAYWDAAPHAVVRFTRDGSRALAQILRPKLRRGVSDAFIWDLRSGGPPRLLEGFRRMPPTVFVRLSPDGRCATAYGGPGTIRIWDARTGRAVGPLLHHREAVREVEFTPDSRSLLTVRADGVVQRWDVQTGRRGGSPMAHPTPVDSTELSADGRVLLTVDRQGLARLWDSRTGEPLAPALRYGGRYAAFMPDGRSLVLATDRGAQLRPLAEEPRPLGELLQLCVFLAGHRSDDVGAHVELDPAALRSAWTALRRGRRMTRRKPGAT